MCYGRSAITCPASVRSFPGIRTLLEAGHAASEAMRGQAQAYLEAQQAKTQEYLDQVQVEPEPDFYPFVELPAGTEPRDLPDGNRLFTLPDGHDPADHG